MYRVFLVEVEDIPAVRLQGAIEVACATDVEEMCTLLHQDEAIGEHASPKLAASKPLFTVTVSHNGHSVYPALTLNVTHYRDTHKQALVLH